MTLVKEDGTGLSGANTYANVADCDSYHEAHLYATDWTGATTATKEAALAMATRLIDGSYQFNGYRTSEEQALQWPRIHCPDTDKLSPAWTALNSGRLRPEFEENEIPTALVNATCEVARELIKADTSDAVDGEGLSRLSVAGSINLEFNKADKQPTIPPTAQLFLSKLGSYLSGKTITARLVRV